MTVLANSSIFYFCRLTLALRSNPAITIELFIGNREHDSETIPVYAALKEIVGIGNELSGHIPALTTGKIVIDNSAGLFGGNKRFSDYLEKYVIVNQDIRLYYNTTESLDESFNTFNSATLFWRDLIFNCNYDDRQATLSLRSDLISNKTIGVKLDSRFVSSIDDSAVGKQLPLVLGANQSVKPVFINTSWNSFTNNMIAYYGWGTTIGATFEFRNKQVNKIYARHRNGYYTEVISAASSPLAGSETTPSGNSKLPNDIGGQAWEMTFVDGHIITAARIMVFKHSSGPAEEEITFGVWSKHPNRAKPDQLIASGGPIVFTDLANGWNNVLRVFDRPLVVEAGETVYFGFFTDTQDNGTISRFEYYHDTVTYNTKKYKTQSGTGEITGRWKGGQQSPNRNYRMALYAMSFGFSLYPSTTTTVNGYALDYISFTSVYTEDNYEQLKNLDIILEVDGIRDSFAGAITGVSYQLLETPQHIANLLSRTWNGSSWAAGNFNSSEYSASYANHTNTGSNYYRLIGGVATGSIQRNRLLAAIGQESLTYFPRVNAANEFAMYSLGLSSNPVAQITDKDILSLRVSVSDMTGVVTIAKGSYLKDLTRADFIEQLSNGGESNYSQFVELRYDDAGIGEAIASNSHTLYGENETAKKTYDWISDATSMQNVLKGIMGINQHPPVFVELDIPFLKYNTLKLFDNVELITSQLPMLEGANTRHHPALYNTNETTPADTDNETFLGYSYRASIISIRYDLMQSSLPIMNIRLRLILNEADPT